MGVEVREEEVVEAEEEDKEEVQEMGIEEVRTKTVPHEAAVEEAVSQDNLPEVKVSLILVLLAVVCSLACSVLYFLLFGHLKRLDQLCGVLVRADAVDIDLVLFDVIDQEVCRVQPDDRALVAVHFNRKHDSLELLVNEAHQV